MRPLSIASAYLAIVPSTELGGGDARSVVAATAAAVVAARALFRLSSLLRLRRRSATRFASATESMTGLGSTGVGNGAAAAAGGTSVVVSTAAAPVVTAAVESSREPSIAKPATASM